jgi:hypothetical protein
LKEDYPILYDIMIYKIDGMQNKSIAEALKKKYGVSYSVEYLSTVWRKKIPKIIAEKAKVDWLIWYYTYKEKGKWKWWKTWRHGGVDHAYHRYATSNPVSQIKVKFTP